MPFRDDEGVAQGDGESVRDGHGVVVSQDDLGFVRVAEGAGRLIGHVTLH